VALRVPADGIRPRFEVARAWAGLIFRDHAPMMSPIKKARRGEEPADEPQRREDALDAG
jgi:hypothetical protein